MTTKLKFLIATLQPTTQVSSIRYGGLAGGQYAIGDGLSYTYDQSGNITHIRQNGTIVVRYAYDKLSRIIREDNKALQATYLFTYDNNGNILSKRTAAFSLSVSTEHLTEFQDELYYGYDAANPDRLVYRAGGNLPTPQVYAYDAFGNPTQYGGTSLTWKNGRQLASYGSLQFTYDGYGKRIKKGDTTYTYDLGGKPVQQSNGTDTLEFFYDQSGLSGCKHGSAQYVYRKNLQGDITHIFTIDGDLKACYTYDAWGNHDVVCYGADGQVTADASHIGNLNPFRYRSYLYDTETGWYFLKTRYYDPQVGRFVSQDAVEYLDPETVNGLNLYAYCGDNPVMRVDPEGTSFLAFLIISIVIGAVVGGVMNGVKATKEGASGWGIFGAILGGAVMGGAMGAVIAFGGAAGMVSIGLAVPGFTMSAGAALGISLAIGAGAGMASYLLENGLRDDRKVTFGGTILAGLMGVAQAAGTFALAYVGGRSGLFAKYAGKTPLGFMEHVYATAGNATTLQSLAYGLRFIAPGFIIKLLLSTVPGIIIRWPFKKMTEWTRR